jgi:large subunit ribosomal protein L25
MKSIELKVSVRKSMGKKDAKMLRRNNQVPCVIYGGKETIHFHAEDKAFKDLVYTNHVYVVHLNIEGKKHLAIMKEIQFHPVSDKLLHIDFIEVALSKPIIVDLPVEITGNSRGIMAGGKLRLRKRYVKVKGLIEHLPDSLIIDISDLDIGQSVLAGDLKYPHVDILDSHRALVVGIISARAAAKGMGEATEVAAPAEGAATATAVAPAAAPVAAPAETKK